jgi:hypothetical protein
VSGTAFPAADEGRAQPSARQVERAAFAAAAAASAPLLPFAPFLAILLFGFACLHAFAIGLPLYRSLRRRRPLTLGAALGWSFLIGAVPMTLILLAVMLATSAADGAAPENGLLAALAAGLEPGLLGMLGGGVFWAMLRGSGPAAPDPQASPPASAA